MEQKQRAKQRIFNQWPGYPHTRTDTWIDVSAILCLVCGFVFMCMILGFGLGTKFLNIFTGLMVGGWTLAWILYLARIFRRMLWQANEERKDKEDTNPSRIKRVLVGIGLVIIAELVSFGLNSLHQFWASLLTIYCTGLLLCGLVLIVQAVKPKKKRNS